MIAPIHTGLWVRKALDAGERALSVVCFSKGRCSGEYIYALEDAEEEGWAQQLEGA